MYVIRCLDHEVVFDGLRCEVRWRGELVDFYGAANLEEAVHLFWERTDLSGLYDDDEDLACVVPKT